MIGQGYEQDRSRSIPTSSTNNFDNPLCFMLIFNCSSGAVAQLGERLNGIQEVDGSIPFSSTSKNQGVASRDHTLSTSFLFSLFSQFQHLGHPPSSSIPL